jgi:glycerol-3-phosphate dehydrogenase (NAD(P)+)
MSTTPTIGVLGGGSWGTALAHLVRLNGHPTLLWLRDKKIARAITNDGENPRYLPDMPLCDGIETTLNIQKITQRCEIILLAVPTHAMRNLLRELGESLRPSHILISCCKGLEAASGKTMSTLITEETCCLIHGALSGPNLAAEVLRGYPSATVIASRYDRVIAQGTKALMGPTFRVYGNNDVLGVEIAGALKNVMAIGAGVVAGLGFGNNTQSLLITRGLAEIRRLGVKMGAESTTFAGLAGVGDLMVTCTSPLSRNHQIGLRLAEGKTLPAIQNEMTQVAEGVSTAKVAMELSRSLDVPLPITTGIYELLYEDKPIQEVLSDLMANQAVYEVDRPITLAT